jgi:hypothetical protein
VTFGQPGVRADGLRRVSCGAVLFPLHWPEPPWFAGFDPEPQQGPSPAYCAREPHEPSPWHWDGKSTWWR